MPIDGQRKCGDFVGKMWGKINISPTYYQYVVIDILPTNCPPQIIMSKQLSVNFLHQKLSISKQIVCVLPTSRSTFYQQNHNMACGMEIIWGKVNVDFCSGQNVGQMKVILVTDSFTSEAVWRLKWPRRPKNHPLPFL